MKYYFADNESIETREQLTAEQIRAAEKIHGELLGATTRIGYVACDNRFLPEFLKGEKK